MDESIRDSFLLPGSSNPAEEKDDRTPFDRFLKDPHVDMLQSALPYVSTHMRKPLALFIKSMEIHRIVNDLDREEVLTACGFESNPPNPEAMLKAMKMAGGPNAGPQIDNLLNMMNLIRSYQSFMEMMQNNPEMASFITNMMNQSQNFTPNSNSNAGNRQNSQNQNSKQGNQSGNENTGGGSISPMDLLSQFAGKDTSDMMALLSQIMKNTQ